MFKKETNLTVFSGLKVHLSSGEEGVITESFGQSGKFKVRIQGKVSNYENKKFLSLQITMIENLNVYSVLFCLFKNRWFEAGEFVKVKLLR